MKLERLNNALTLDLGEGKTVAFRDEWIVQLRALAYDKYGEYIRTTIYPALSDDERKLWNRTTVNNLDLQAALQAEV
jgi:hypothetical protein